MDRFKEIESFVSVAAQGSLSAVAKLEGVQPAVIGRRIDSLEERLGVKLMLRTTRKLTLTHEGTAYLEDCQRILNEMASADAAVGAGGARATGLLRVSAPAGFGRRHVAPLVKRFMGLNPEVKISLDLTDRMVDLVNENVDCAVRIGSLPDSSMISIKLGETRRVVVASPEYLQRFGKPGHPYDLLQHRCLGLGPNRAQSRGWNFMAHGEALTLRITHLVECNDGAVLRDWAVSGLGLAWRSYWEVREDLASGALMEVLHDFAAPPMGIFALFPQRRHLPLRVRLFVDLLKLTYGDLAYWESGGTQMPELPQSGDDE
ncbi:LysR family transcriptional regulator [Methyloversatilis sp.]|uniref:LysR family transcriptional regulator n=2 Tax=Methyloversatilis sp. TaxID=2569862 RepID=UPI002736329C|nr:LysR family transcriptional regulator [Methyloversatilis sp.]MDP3289860.1 LysR family transcriptional regulator [Methyloversatilis sp.]MDP3456422.1 LysR family transcriptional regulator [Methyloversatilis sp.]MDP3577720.1 LysR family transcriptional regulator [Methyloversatilis sp.]